MASNLVAYHKISPDPVVDGCMNTGEGGDGVVFLNVEPLVGVHLFIGRQSIIEAVAELYGITPVEVDDLLTAESTIVDTGKVDLSAVQERARLVVADLEELAASPAALPPMQAKPVTGAHK